MYKPKKHIRLSSLFQAPKLGDIRTLFSEGTKAKGCTVELPWVNKRTGVNYSLTVRAEISGGQPMWTLYEGEGAKSRVVWSSPFEDVDLLYDVLTLSIPEEALPLGTRETAKPEPERIKEAEEARASLQDANAQLLTPKQPASFYEEGLLKEEELETYKRAEMKRAQEEEKERKREELLAKERAAREKEEKDKEKEKQPEQAPQVPPPQPGAPYGVPPYPPPYPYYQGYPPGYVPPPYPYYPGYPPGYYPYPGQGPIPPVPPVPQNPPLYPAGTVGMGTGQFPIPGQYETTGQLPAFEPQPQAKKIELGLKLGQFLVEAGLVPQPTVDAALQLQDLVRSGKLPTQKAAEAVRRAHIRGGEVDPALTASRDVQTYSVQGNAPPLGQILVEAAILRGPVLRSVLQLQQKVRAGNITQEEAFDVLYKEVFGVGKEKEDTDKTKSAEKKATKEFEFTTKECEDALILLKVAGLLSDFDIESARKVALKHNSNVLKILKTSGKLDEFTLDASVKLAKMVDANKFKPDQAVIALHFCQRSRVSLEDALKELGWQI